MDLQKKRSKEEEVKGSDIKSQIFSFNIAKFSLDGLRSGDQPPSFLCILHNIVNYT